MDEDERGEVDGYPCGAPDDSGHDDDDGAVTAELGRRLVQ